MARILIIEDEESYRDATGFMLRKEGFEVFEAPDGAAGLALYDTHGADLVLLDLMMPGMPGTEVCRVIRTTANTTLSPINARNLRQAHALLESGKTQGKIVLSGF